MRSQIEKRRRLSSGHEQGDIGDELTKKKSLRQKEIQESSISEAECFRVAIKCWGKGIMKRKLVALFYYLDCGDDNGFPGLYTCLKLYTLCSYYM